MKKGVIFGILILSILILADTASAATLTSTDVSSSFVIASITNAQNVYGYEITYAVSGDVSAVNFYNFLLNESDGTSTTNGYLLRGGNVSIYESRLDNQIRGISGNGNLFNITHTGTLTLKSMLLTYNNGVEETTNYNQDGTTIITIITSSGGGGGGVSQVEHYTLKILSPGDITLPKEGVISVPISVENTGLTTLKGIHLSSNVTFNNLLSNDVIISLENSVIDKLEPGESKKLTITINANTKKQGIYKITIFAEVDSPRFSDWGEFYIEFKKTSEGDVDKALASLEKLISENVDCLGFSEMADEARVYMEQRDFTKSMASIQQATAACENAIYQKSIYKKLTRGVDQTILTYVIILTVSALILGVIFYIYRRYKFQGRTK